MGSWKRAEKLKWSTSIFIIQECSKQCLKNPWQDLSMQFHSTGCRHEYTEFCKHGHAWFTDLSMQNCKMLKFNSALKVPMQRNTKKLPSGLSSAFHLKDHLCTLEEASILQSTLGLQNTNGLWLRVAWLVPRAHIPNWAWRPPRENEKITNFKLKNKYTKHNYRQFCHISVLAFRL